jgi:hypothetical protein
MTFLNPEGKTGSRRRGPSPRQTPESQIGWTPLWPRSSEFAVGENAMLRLSDNHERVAGIFVPGMAAGASMGGAKADVAPLAPANMSAPVGRDGEAKERLARFWGGDGGARVPGANLAK